jgi:hypothetical protein
MLSGDLSSALYHARMAHARSETDLLDQQATILAITTTLRQEAVEGRITIESAVRLADALVHRRLAPLLAALIVIRLSSTQHDIETVINDYRILEILDVLAADQDCLSDTELLQAAVSLSR